MIKKETQNQLFTRILTGTIFSLIIISSYFFAPSIVFSSLLALILFIIIFLEWPRLFSPRQPVFWLLMPFYPILPFALLILMNQDLIHRSLLVPLFVLVFAHDTGSYIAGNLFGKHAIAPSISPNKTIEGFLGGYFFATAACIILLVILSNYAYLPMIPVFTIAICLISTMGDFFESWLKRKAGVKDSGSLLPGHGGFLDRFDGIMFVSVFFYFLKDKLIVFF